MEAVEGSEKLTQIFGSWPSFHDAEILSLTLDRSGPEAPTLEARICVFEPTSDADENGHFHPRKQQVVTLLFTRILLEELRGFNEQNVIFSLGISPIEDAPAHGGRRVAVDLSSSYGVGGFLECERIIVSAVAPLASAV